MCERDVKMGGGIGEEKKKEDPLTNSLIMETIFDYLSVPELKVVRQVSTYWNDCAQRKWDKSVKLRIDGAPHWLEEAKYKRFIQVLTGEEVSPLEPGIHGNWTTLCGKIKILELVNITFPTINSLRNALFVSFPNLKHLILGPVVVLKVGHLSSEPTAEQPFQLPVEDEQGNLRSLTVNMKETDSHLPISWMEVLAHFPALEALNLTDCHRSKADPLFQAVHEIRDKDPSKLKLKHLLSKISAGNITPATLSILMDARLRLKTLSLLVLWNSRAASQFRDILQVHAGTLKKLEFTCFQKFQFPHNPPMPQLKVLQELKITMKFHSKESLKFLQFTPNLKKLVLHPFNLRGLVSHFNLNQFPVMLKSCEELEILDDTKGVYSLEDMKSLVEWMPKLKTLKIGSLDNDKFAVICENWTELVELHVRESEVSSAGMLGWENEEKLWWAEDEIAARPITMVKKPNITNLKKLQILTMSANGGPLNRLNLSRAVGLYGIEKLPDLQRLRLNDYGITPKDCDYWKQLHERYPCPVGKPAGH